MRRRPMAVRRGPGLVGTMARTAVIAGTATAVSGGVTRHQQNKAQAQQAEIDEQQQLADVQEQMNAMQAQQAQAAIAGTPPAAAAPPTDMAGQLQQLASMKESGVLTEEEFQAAKAKLLAG